MDSKVPSGKDEEYSARMGGNHLLELHEHGRLRNRSSRVEKASPTPQPVTFPSVTYLLQCDVTVVNVHLHDIACRAMGWKTNEARIDARPSTALKGFYPVGESGKEGDMPVHLKEPRGPALKGMINRNQGRRKKKRAKKQLVEPAYKKMAYAKKAMRWYLATDAGDPAKWIASKIQISDWTSLSGAQYSLDEDVPRFVVVQERGKTLAALRLHDGQVWMEAKGHNECNICQFWLCTSPYHQLESSDKEEDEEEKPLKKRQRVCTNQQQSRASFSSQLHLPAGAVHGCKKNTVDLITTKVGGEETAAKKAGDPKNPQQPSDNGVADETTTASFAAAAEDGLPLNTSFSSSAAHRLILPDEICSLSDHAATMRRSIGRVVAIHETFQTTTTVAIAQEEIGADIMEEEKEDYNMEDEANEEDEDVTMTTTTGNIANSTIAASVASHVDAVGPEQDGEDQPSENSQQRMPLEATSTGPFPPETTSSTNSMPPETTSSGPFPPEMTSSADSLLAPEATSSGPFPPETTSSAAPPERILSAAALLLPPETVASEASSSIVTLLAAAPETVSSSSSSSSTALLLCPPPESLQLEEGAKYRVGRVIAILPEVPVTETSNQHSS